MDLDLGSGYDKSPTDGPVFHVPQGDPWSLGPLMLVRGLRQALIRAQPVTISSALG